jgi:hypothetical protein
VGAGGGLSTGAKAGIGAGATIAGLSLAFGAFFLGVIVHRRSRKPAKYMEDWDNGEKPQLDGKAVYGPVVFQELDATRSMQELHATNGYIPELAACKSRSQSTVDPTPAQSESTADTRQLVNNSEPISPQQQQPLGGSSHLDSRVSPLANHHDGPIVPLTEGQEPRGARTDTYDDPRLVQNPWAQDDTPVHK